MNPGPVNATPRVRRALLGPDICHREKEFSGLLGDIRARLLRIFRIEKTHTAAFFTGPGTSALEAALVSYAGRKRKVLVLSNGVYGGRMRDILARSGAPVRFLEAPIGRFPSSAEIESALKKDAAIEGIAVVHHETSSGALNPLGEVARLAHKHGKVLLVDAISSLGGERIDFGRIAPDFLVGNSGKCLHGFPGVAFVLLSHRAAALVRASEPVSVALDLRAALQNAEKGDTAFTPAVQVFYAFREALAELEKEGLRNRVASYKKRSTFLEKIFEGLRLDFVVKKKLRSHVLTAVWTPKGIAYEALHDRLKKEGFVIYAGQSKLKGRIFRVANLGDIRPADLRRFRSALGRALARRS